MVVMINGKKRGIVEVSSNINQDGLIDIINKDVSIPIINGDKFKKIIFVENKIINFVTMRNILYVLVFLLSYLVVLISLCIKKMLCFQSMVLNISIKSKENMKIM